MSEVRWGIIGPGKIANNFADALKESYSGKLKGIASLNQRRREDFGNKYNIENQFRFNTYDELLESSEIDAVYISRDMGIPIAITQRYGGKGKSCVCQDLWNKNVN